MRIVIFAKRELNEEDTMQFVQKQETIKKNLASNQDELENLYNEIEKDLTFISALGIKEQLRKNAIKTLDLFKQSDMKVWMLSGDSY